MSDATDRLGQADRLDLYTVEIAVASPLYYCTGNEPFVYGGQEYWPRTMRLWKSLPSAEPSNIRRSLLISARPAEGEEFGPFASYLADNTLQNSTVTISHFVWSNGWGDPVSVVDWVAERAGGAPGFGGDHNVIKLQLSAYTGFRPGKGLSRGEQGCDLLNGDGVMCTAASGCNHTWSTCQKTDKFVGNRWMIEDQTPIMIGGRAFEPSGPQHPPIRQWRWRRDRQIPPEPLAPTGLRHGSGGRR